MKTAIKRKTKCPVCGWKPDPKQSFKELAILCCPNCWETNRLKWGKNRLEQWEAFWTEIVKGAHK